MLEGEGQRELCMTKALFKLMITRIILKKYFRVHFVFVVLIAYCGRYAVTMSLLFMVIFFAKQTFPTSSFPFK